MQRIQVCAALVRPAATSELQVSESDRGLALSLRARFENTAVVLHGLFVVVIFNGRIVRCTVVHADVVVYKESPGTPEPPPEVREDVRVFERNLTYCSAPMFGAIDTQRLLEWIEFHRSYLRMYDAGAMDDDVMAALRPYLRAGIMDITDIRGAALYDTWSYAQVGMAELRWGRRGVCVCTHSHDGTLPPWCVHT
ncbi:unnamed protein product [Closterium sp. NIES-54]